MAQELRLRARRWPEPRKSELLGRGLQIVGAMVRRLSPVAAHEALHLCDAIHRPGWVGGPLRHAFEDLGGTFIKFGQLIASSPGLFGDDLSAEFRSCLDTGPPVPFASVQAIVQDDLGLALSDAFSEFDPDPIGSASIAVVHRARLRDGRPVAVKVLRPGIQTLVATDLALMVPLFELLARVTGEQIAGSTLQVLDGFRVQMGEELDLRNEARALAWFRELFSSIDVPLLVVPEPHVEFSGPNVLTMELLDGTPIDDLSKAAQLGVDPVPLVKEVIRAFFITTVRWGVFHGDLHAGNMMLLDDGRLGVVDWGIVGRLDAATHRFFLRLLDAVLGDGSAWPDVTGFLVRTYGPVIQEGMGLSGEALTSFIRGLVEPTLTRPFGEVSLATLLQAPQVQAARAHGIEAHHKSVRSILRRFRAQRRLLRLADQSGYTSSAFDRGTFLLGKQLMYFERYGKLLLADEPLIDDPTFFAQVLAEARAPAGEVADPVAEGRPRAAEARAPADPAPRLPPKTGMCSTFDRDGIGARGRGGRA